MPIPDYQTMMLPILQIASDGKQRRNANFYQAVAEYFNLSDGEKRELLPGGSQPTYQNRCNWATIYLYNAGLLDRPQRGVYQINEPGWTILAQKPERIDVNLLNSIPRFAAWRGKSNKTKPTPSVRSGDKPAADSPSQNPEESLQRIAQDLKDLLASELLDQLQKMDSLKFEQLIVDLMLAMGYGGSRAEAGEVTQASNDGGIDGIISEDRLGLDKIYLQAKKWNVDNTVGRREVQNFVGALAGQQAHKGVFITTSAFNRNAIEYAAAVPQRVILIDGQRLAKLMIDCNIGVSTSQTIEIKKIDTDYFES